MENPKEIKNQLHKYCQDHVQQRLDTVQKAIADTIKAAKDENKSSMGDKYETGLAMMHIEREKKEAQLRQAFDLQTNLKVIYPNKEHEIVEPGSLVITNYGRYYIAIGLGKAMIDEEVFYVVSIESPIAQALKDKKAGDAVKFLNKNYKIEGVY